MAAALDPEGCETGRRILRLTGPRGIGKGALLHELKLSPKMAGPDNWTGLFKKVKDMRYGGAFFAHTSFSPEFNSVISALVRFVAHLTANKDDVEFARKILIEELADSKKEKEDAGESATDVLKIDTTKDFRRFPRLLRALKVPEEPLWRWNPEIDVLSQLARVLERFRDTNNGRRLFICLGGLDRICDGNGVAFAPQHRAFFRILADTDMAKVPMDIVLIAGSTRAPLLYLSRSLPMVAGPTPGRPALEPWNSLPTLAVDNRYWLKQPLTGTGAVGSRAEGQGVTQFASDPVIRRTGGTRFSALRSLLDESVAMHTWIANCARECFALSQGGPQGGNWTALDAWLQHLNEAAYRGGRYEVLEAVFVNYRAHDGEEHWQLFGAILKHLPLFAVPVTAPTLLQCPGIAGLAHPIQPNQPSGTELKVGAGLRMALEALHRRGLVVWVQIPSLEPDANVVVKTRAEDAKDKAATEGETCLQDTARADGTAILVWETQRFVLHSQVREHVAHQMRLELADRGERNHFEVSTYCLMPRDLPTPSEEHFRLVHGIVQALIDKARTTLGPYYDENQAITDQHAGPFYDVVQMLRAAYSVLRDSFSIGTLSRLRRFSPGGGEPEEPFELYRGWLRSLLNAAAAIHHHSARLRDLVAKAGLDPEMRHPFYRSEILWLYNERGLTSFLQGRLYDAVPIFERAIRFSQRNIDGTPGADAHRATERRIALNLAIAEIERGNLKQARESLLVLATRTPRSDGVTPSTTRNLALGYLGLCDHLSGHLDMARVRYEEAITFAREHRHLRTISIFQRHLADLLRILGEQPAAEALLKKSLYAAAEEEQKDILTHTLLAQARLARDMSANAGYAKLREALTLLDQAERFADEMGIVKIKAEALKIRSEIMIEQGESEHAGRLAARAIGLANRHGMRLRKLSALIVYARIQHARGQETIARDLLVETSREAGLHGYQLKAVQAEKTLRGLFAD